MPWTVVETEELRRASIFTLAILGALLMLGKIERFGENTNENAKESERLRGRKLYREPIPLKKRQLRNGKSEAQLGTK